MGFVDLGEAMSAVGLPPRNDGSSAQNVAVAVDSDWSLPEMLHDGDSVSMAANRKGNTISKKNLHWSEVGLLGITDYDCLSSVLVTIN